MVSTRAMIAKKSTKSASWPEPSAEEYSHNNKALAKDVVVFSTMIYILFYLSSTINEVTYDFPMSQLIGSLITSSVMILVMFLCRFKIRFLVLLATTVDVTYHFFEFFFIFFTHSIHFHSLVFLLRDILESTSNQKRFEQMDLDEYYRTFRIFYFAIIVFTNGVHNV